MAGDTLTLRVVTPESTVVTNLPVKSMVVPMATGYLGILPNHAPIVAALRVGVLKYKDGDTYRAMAVGGGFLEVADNQATVLVDTAEVGGDVDVLRAKASLERAQARLRERQSHVDFTRAESALERARARLRAAEEDPNHASGPITMPRDLQ